MSGQTGQDRTGAVEFWFDFTSPYGYFTSFKLDELAGRFARSVHWKPFQLASAIEASGRGAIMGDTVVRDHLRHDIERMARLDSRPFRWPRPFPLDSRRAIALYYWQLERDPALARPLAQTIFHAAFGEGRDIGGDAVLLEAAAQAGIDAAAASGALADPACLARVDAVNAEARRRGVFGSPFIFADGEPFWGSDRLWMVKRWLDWGGW